MESDYSQPINIGNPDEHSIKTFATMIRDLVGGNSEITHLPPVQDDPQRRRPDIDLAKRVLGWKPQVALEKGLRKTVEYFSKELGRTKHSDRNNGDPGEYQL